MDMIAQTRRSRDRDHYLSRNAENLVPSDMGCIMPMDVQHTQVKTAHQ